MNGSSSTNGHANGNGTQDVDLEGMEYDPAQLEMMKEELIVVDNDDNPIGQDSKKTCKSAYNTCHSCDLFDTHALTVHVSQAI